jgi:Cdc6-like AAA superfamily ATPase
MVEDSANLFNIKNTFVITNSFKELHKAFKILKIERGKILHVVGAPGTGKSTNINHAIESTGLAVYDVKLVLDNVNKDSKSVYNKIFRSIKDDLGVSSKIDALVRLSDFDAVLFADNFHDSHILKQGNIGFSKWTNSVGIKALSFYFMCIFEYLRNIRYYKNINIVLQTAWRVYINGKKYDLFADFGFFSKIFINILSIFFNVVEISYSEPEIIKIVKKHVKNAHEENIKISIQRYGYKPRFIIKSLEEVPNQPLFIKNRIKN